MRKENPLKYLEEEYSLRIIQYLQLNPNGRTFEQICGSINTNVLPSEIIVRLKSLEKLGLVLKEKDESFRVVFSLSQKGKLVGELIWDLFRMIVNPEKNNERSNQDLLDFYR